MRCLCENDRYHQSASTKRWCKAKAIANTWKLTKTSGVSKEDAPLVFWHDCVEKLNERDGGRGEEEKGRRER